MPAGEGPEREQHQRKREPLEPRLHPRGEHEHQHGEQVEREVEVGQQDHREGHHQPRKLDLAHQVLAVQDGGHRAAGGVGEEGVEHHAGEQDRGVVRHALAQLHELGEDHVEDPEQHQRPHQLPEVAEHRAEEAQLELQGGQRDGELEQPASGRCRGRRVP